MLHEIFLISFACISRSSTKSNVLFWMAALVKLDYLDGFIGILHWLCVHYYCISLFLFNWVVWLLWFWGEYLRCLSRLLLHTFVSSLYVGCFVRLYAGTINS